MPESTIKVAILEDHQSIIDGYMFRLRLATKIEVVGTVMLGEELESFLAGHSVDVLILDVNVPASVDNPNPFPVLQVIPSILKKYPELRILAISVNIQPALIEALLDAGVHGYVYKDDTGSIQRLPQIVELIAGGGNYFSEGVFQKMRGSKSAMEVPKLTLRQQRLLSLCLAYPDMFADEMAVRLGVSASTVRNMLSEIYVRLGVHTKAAAIAKAHTLGIVGEDGFPRIQP